MKHARTDTTLEAIFTYVQSAGMGNETKRKKLFCKCDYWQFVPINALDDALPMYT